MVNTLARLGTIAAVVVAAGGGTRFGSGRLKQFAELGGRPMVWHSVAGLARHPMIARCVVVLPEDHLERGRTLLADLGAAVDCVAGGATRQASVLQGLEALARSAEPPDRVLIHDGARPLLDRALIDRLCEALAGADAVIPTLAIQETVKQVDAEGRIRATLERADLRLAQTPQGFIFASILAAHRDLAHETLTDDAALIEHLGGPVRAIPGAPDNIKITTPGDLETAARLMARASAAPIEWRTGQGYDVHRLGPGSSIRLCGIDLAFDRALIGHSDADVALHALTDAILGAGALGDIGQHFPPGDPRWQGASSALFVEAAIAMLEEVGGRLAHADLTIICEAPRIAPHRAAMQARVAELAGLAPASVNIKATTTEGLGFAGRGEGIAAMAVATARFG